MNYDTLQLVFVVVGLILGLTLHEFAHGLVAHKLGDSTARDQGRLSLNPLAHIDIFSTLLLPLFLIIAHFPVFAAAKPVPFKPWALRWGRWGSALVSVAGPLTNLIIALVCALWLRFVVSGGAIPYIALGSIVQVNVGLFIFNLIPVPPLDGSRVLYAAAPAGVREVMDNIERAGLMVIFLMVLLLWYTPLGQYLGEAITGLTAFLLPHSPLP
jgi:Zn-dependent protease